MALLNGQRHVPHRLVELFLYEPVQLSVVFRAFGHKILGLNPACWENLQITGSCMKVWFEI